MTKKSTVWIAVLAMSLIAAGSWAGDAPLWKIGDRDNRTDGLALAPNGYGQYARDAVFVVGKSNPKKDWPYCQPGPDDAWAKPGPHTFTILFELKNAPEAPCHLILDLADTQSAIPPRIAITVNGKEKTFGLKPGAGDASIFGDASKGTEQVVDRTISPDQLVAGLNRITITTQSGSWLLYDGLEFRAPAGVKLSAVKSVTALQSVEGVSALVKENGELRQLVRANLINTGASAQGTLVVEGGSEKKFDLVQGDQTVELTIPPVDKPTQLGVHLLVNGKEAGQAKVAVAPVRKWELYLLHHTHLDIGYTHVQSDVEKKQWDHLDKAIELARASKDYPEGSRFKWLPEGLWAVDSYVKQASPEKKAAFIDAVNQGWVGLDALYGSELTALCRPEELLELTGCARRLSRELARPIDSAMITDVPGYTWGLIPVLAQSGVKYFSIGPNRGHRIGRTLTAWGDKPFYWLSPSGNEKVLCWVAAEGYSWFHSAPLRSDKKVFEYLDRLEKLDYRFDVAHLRYNVGGDNGPPDAQIADIVRTWNEKYAYPKLILATPHEFFSAFEQRYGKDLPQVSGDFTPYWEDGAASTARETVINRDAAEKVVQGNALWAMMHPPSIYPAAKVQDAFLGAF